MPERLCTLLLVRGTFLSSSFFSNEDLSTALAIGKECTEMELRRKVQGIQSSCFAIPSFLPSFLPSG
jgi:hypothetical protein